MRTLVRFVMEGRIPTLARLAKKCPMRTLVRFVMQGPMPGVVAGMSGARRA
jgi:hypothetical protein